MKKNIEISFLLDFYGELLKPQQCQALELYYNDDLSLAEISLQLGITRQGVRDTIKRGEKRLFDFEDKLGLRRRFNEVEKGLYEIERLSESLRESYNTDTVGKIISTAKALHE